MLSPDLRSRLNDLYRVLKKPEYRELLTELGREVRAWETETQVLRSDVHRLQQRLAPGPHAVLPLGFYTRLYLLKTAPTDEQRLLILTEIQEAFPEVRIPPEFIPTGVRVADLV